MNSRFFVGTILCVGLLAVSGFAFHKLHSAETRRGKQHKDPPPGVRVKPTKTGATANLRTAETLEKSSNKKTDNARWSIDQKRPSWYRGGGMWLFNWPEEKHFQSLWRSWGKGTGAHVVLAATALKEADKGERLWTMAANPDGTVTVELIPWLGEYGGASSGRLSVPLKSLRPGPIELKQGGETIGFNASHVFHYSGRHASAYDDWVYTHTLLTFEPPAKRPQQGKVWDRGKDEEKQWKGVMAAMKAGREKGLAAIRGHLAKGSSYDSRWGEVIAFVEKHGDQDLLLKVYAIYRPVGRCSMDTYPQTVAREHADACKKAGRLGCYLQMSVRVMADNFTRAVYSSYGEQSHGTESHLLNDTGVDTGRFLRGLLFHFPSQVKSPVGIGLWRLSRSMRESGRSKAFVTELQALAGDSTLDEANRLRVTVTLAYLHMGAGKSNTQTAQKMDRLNLSETSKMWLEKLAAGKTE
jgi:hypothetical protein